MPFGYAMEALGQLGLNDVPVLKLDIIYPLNYKEITDFLRDLDKATVIEELEPFLQVKVAEIAHAHQLQVEIIG